MRSYFTRRLTIVVGPPGTGKSTLIDAILQLEEEFRHRVWVCTNSNTAVDVLADKVCQRKSSPYPPGFFRVRTLFKEGLSSPPIQQQSAVRQIEAAETHPQAPHTQAHQTIPQATMKAIQDFLATQKHTDYDMALEHTIKLRIRAITRIATSQVPPLWETEHDDLLALIQCFQALVHSRDAPSIASVSEDALKKVNREREFNGALRTLQRGYATRARVISSTMAAAASTLLKGWKPHSIIMDEASQFIEARAVFPILKALTGGNLRKIFLVGDHNQLPPTIMAPRNVFAESGKVSLMERLIRAGTPPIQPRTQYRMEPTTSSIVNRVMYSGSLVDGPNTTQHPTIAQFQ